MARIKKLVSPKDIRRSFNAFATHWGIGALAVVVIVSGLLPKQAANASASRTRTVIELASAGFFNESVNYDEVIVTVGEDSDYVFKTGATETIISKNNRNQTILYEVKPNESVASIARDFGISPDTLRYANKLDGNAVTAGQKLKVPPLDGIYVAVSRNDTLSSISKKYRVSVADITKYNGLDSSQPIFAGQELLVPGVVAPKTPISGPSGSATISPSGVDARIAPANVGQFIWPTQSATHFISQGYKSSHRALDLNRLNGWGIYAAAAGRVSVHVSRYGYGNQIDINHGGGFVTRYAHLSEFKVKNGDYVEQGQLIGIMGSTGRSTGPHLHFEIRTNDVPLNPLNYLPR